MIDYTDSDTHAIKLIEQGAKVDDDNVDNDGEQSQPWTTQAERICASRMHIAGVANIDTASAMNGATARALIIMDGAPPPYTSG